MSRSPTELKAEPAAKAALLSFLRDSERLSRGCIITTELILDKHSVRADVVTVDRDNLHCFEIKTQRDTLARLDKQVDTYAAHADFVTVVAASKHINAVLSRVPPFVGVFEMLSIATPNEIRVVREPQRSPLCNADAMLSLLPATDLRSRLAVKGKLRADLMAAATAIPSATKKAAVLEFLRDRYLPTSLSLMRAARRRKILPKDLLLLRRWTREPSIPTVARMKTSAPGTDSCADTLMYEHIKESFGPVPEHIRLLLVG